MSKRVDFSYSITGGFDSVNYYRSELPMNPASLPVATATGITAKNYSDSTVTEGKDYCIRFESVKGVDKKLSSEISIDTSINEVDLLIVADATSFPSTTIVDYSKNMRAITRFGDTKIINTHALLYSNGTIYFDGNGDYLSSTVTQLNTLDFTLEVRVSMNHPSSNSFSRIFQFGSEATGYLSLFRNDATNPAGYTLHTRISGNVSTSLIILNASSQYSIKNDVFAHVCVMRKNGIFYLFVNGNLIGSNASYTTHQITATSLYLMSAGAANYSAGYLDSFRLTKFARYNTSGFTPPQFKFAKT